MKIAIVINKISGGGAERVACNLANYLVRKEHDVTIIVLSKVENIYDLDPKVLVKALVQNEGKNKYAFFSKIIYAFNRYLDRNKNDCYVAFLPISILLTLMFKKKAAAPIIISERNDPGSYSQILQKCLKRIAHRADAIVFQTEEAKEWYVPHIGSNVVTRIIPNAITDKILEMPIIALRNKKIVAVGRLTYQKNYELLLKVFARLISDVSDYILEIYGDGELKEKLVDQTRKLGISDYVVFYGYVKDVPSKIANAKAYVLSSNYEGMPNALIEAMALGVPAVATDCPCGGPRYLIENGLNGILVEVDNEDQMYHALRQLLTDNSVWNRIHENAVQIRDKLNPVKIYSEWEDLLTIVLQKTQEVVRAYE